MSENERYARCPNIKKPEYKVKRLCHDRACRTENSRNNPVGRCEASDGKRQVPPKRVTSKIRRSTSLTLIDTKPSSRGESSSSGDCIKFKAELPPESSKRDELIWRVLYSFSKTLSRKRKDRINSLKKELDKSNETTSKLNIQISLLKSIIRSDEKIRENWKKRLLDVKKILGSALDENVKLKNEFGAVSENVEKIKDKLNDLETENNNYKNTQIFLKSECSAFEQQLKKERDGNALLRYETDLQIKKLNKTIDDTVEENAVLRNEFEELKKDLDEKSECLTESESNLQNTSRLWQNSVKEINQLNKETVDLQRANKVLKEQISSLKSSMSILEDNQEEIYKYFNLNIS